MSKEENAIGRRMLLSTGAAVAGLGLLADLEAYPQNVNRNSIPSDLKVTAIRIAVLDGPGGQGGGGGGGGRGGPRGTAPSCDSRHGRGIGRHDRRPNRYQSGSFGLRPDDWGRPPAQLRADAQGPGARRKSLQR